MAEASLLHLLCKNEAKTSVIGALPSCAGDVISELLYFRSRAQLSHCFTLFIQHQKSKKNPGLNCSQLSPGGDGDAFGFGLSSQLRTENMQLTFWTCRFLLGLSEQQGSVPVPVPEPVSHQLALSDQKYIAH